jgi:drug/metabolite transporter (DMT)-like permease
MPTRRVLVLTVLSLLAFAGNSLLCRLALRDTAIDPASFTGIRLIAGALVLYLLVQSRSPRQRGGGDWVSALALFAYAAGFSFAYVGLSAATGALLLFAAVQVTMIGHGLWRGERLRGWQLPGLLLAVVGLVVLLLPGLAAPPLDSAGLMIVAGLAWGVYSLRGRGSADAARATAGNFARAVPFAVLLSLFALDRFAVDSAGIIYALVSGAITSGLGYLLWYSVLPALRATQAAIVQLSVPVLTAVAGVVLLDESMSLRLGLASISVLGGIALVIAGGLRGAASAR